jgi:glycosyltransferase involved in cell wall biosynthesis
LLVDFEDPQAIAEAIIRLQSDPALCRDMGRRGKEGFLARHNWEVEVEPLLQTIRAWGPARGRA